MNQTIFNILLQPIEVVMTSISTSIDQESLSQKLFFTDFVRKLFFAYLEQVSSLRSLPIELQSNRKCRELDLFYTPFSTLKDSVDPNLLKKSLITGVSDNLRYFESKVETYKIIDN